MTQTACSRTFIIGSPRSGTTWVAKLFDAHPWVLYRHEPDSVIPNSSIPGLVPPDAQDEYLELAGEYVDRLYGISTVKTNGAKPAFPKAYRGPWRHACNRGMFYLLRMLETQPALQQWARRVPLPDCVKLHNNACLHLVIKSVIAGGRAALYARARPDDHFVLVLRHPAGYVASELRGRRLGRMQASVPVAALSQTAGAIERGLTLEALQDMSHIEQLSWSWLLFNEKMLRETRDLNNCLLVSYDRMCEDPGDAVTRMYAHAGLSLLPETKSFLDQTQTTDPSEADYFSLFRDPLKSANKWQHELKPEQLAQIRAITAHSEPGRLFDF